MNLILEIAMIVGLALILTAPLWVMDLVNWWR